ncbi:MAG: FlgD immunoglobulin-like domain containing protein, partial [Elusimicrobiota bacterium]
VGEGYARDATVIRHEYTHYVIDQVYPVLNYGQHGAISEALADYFAAASFSFNDPIGADVTAIGKYTNSGLGYEGALREIDTAKASARIFPTHWTGEIHDDSLFVSQALYEIRRDIVAAAANPSFCSDNGIAPALCARRCADKLVFRSFFYFPDNFTDLLAAMVQVSSRSATLAPECGANGTQDGTIRARFSGHGIVERAAPSAGQDAYEPNDGAQSATDVTTASVISGNIYPAADQDYFAAGAGAGSFRAVLSLPEHSEAPGTHYAYGLTLLDGKFNILKTADPLIDVNPSLNGGCPNLLATPCLTTVAQVSLEYDNPSAGQLYLVVAAGITDTGSNDRTSSTRAYALKVESSRSGALATTIAASYDRDVIGFSVSAAAFPTAQNFVFHRARLRDHALVPLPDTATDGATSYLTVQGSTSSGGLVSGTLKLADLSPSLPGFAVRFPSVGTVYLEVFGRNPLGRSQSLGFSNALHLGGRSAELSAWNNVFNPLRGEKATAKYEILEPGQVTLRLFTVNGSLVRTLVDEAKPAGKGSVDWDGTNSAGSRVASGIYLLHLKAPGITKTQKIIVIK